jgi:hypothetical protein
MPRPLQSHWEERYPGSEYSADEREFMAAMERYQRVNRVRYPLCTDVLKVIKSLGYRKTPHSNPLPQGEREHVDVGRAESSKPAA